MLWALWALCSCLKEVRHLLCMWKSCVFYRTNWYNWRNGVPSGVQVFLWSHTLQVLLYQHSKPWKAAAGKEHTERGHLKGSENFSTTGSWAAQHIESEHVVAWRLWHCVLIQQARQTGNSAHLADNLSLSELNISLSTLLSRANFYIANLFNERRVQSIQYRLHQKQKLWETWPHKANEEYDVLYMYRELC